MGISRLFIGSWFGCLEEFQFLFGPSIFIFIMPLVPSLGATLSLSAISHGTDGTFSGFVRGVGSLPALAERREAQRLVTQLFRGVTKEA